VTSFIDDLLNGIESRKQGDMQSPLKYITPKVEYQIWKNLSFSNKLSKIFSNNLSNIRRYMDGPIFAARRKIRRILKGQTVEAGPRKHELTLSNFFA
jgi:hypothetical protein